MPQKPAPSTLFVTQIAVGAGLTISPSGGTGLVTVSLAAGQSPVYNLTTTTSLKVDTGTKTVAAVAGAATLSKNSGVVTSEALTTAAGATYTLTLTNTKITATSQVVVSVGNGTNTGGIPTLATVTPAAGSAVIVVHNAHASAALNGTITVTFLNLTA